MRLRVPSVAQGQVGPSQPDTVVLRGLIDGAVQCRPDPVDRQGVQPQRQVELDHRLCFAMCAGAVGLAPDLLGQRADLVEPALQPVDLRELRPGLDGLDGRIAQRREVTTLGLGQLAGLLGPLAELDVRGQARIRPDRCGLELIVDAGQTVESG